MGCTQIGEDRTVDDELINDLKEDLNIYLSVIDSICRHCAARG